MPERNETSRAADCVVVVMPDPSTERTLRLEKSRRLPPGGAVPEERNMPTTPDEEDRALSQRLLGLLATVQQTTEEHILCMRTMFEAEVARDTTVLAVVCAALASGQPIPRLSRDIPGVYEADTQLERDRYLRNLAYRRQQDAYTQLKGVHAQRVHLRRLYPEDSFSLKFDPEAGQMLATLMTPKSTG